MGAFCSSFCSFFFGCLGHQTHDPKGTSLVKDRSCTDKLILLLYIAAWVGSVIVISMAAKLGGNPFKIINAVDMEGNICGYSEGFKDKSLGALVNPLMTDTSLLDVWRCVDSCDQTQDANNAYFAKNYVSTSFFGYCIPTFNISASGSVDFQAQSQFDEDFDSAQRTMTRAMSDLANSWEVIMISAFVALFASYLYMWLTKRLAGIIIWLCILLVIVGGFFLGYSFLKLAGDAPSGTSDRRVQAYQVSGYLFIAATAVFVLVILGLSSQITIAIEVVKEGSRAINDMKLIIFTPLIPMICACLYFIYWIYGALYIFSVSDLKKKSTPDGAAFYQSPHVNAGARTGNPYPEYDSFDINDSYRPLAAYWLFHMFWSVQFLVYFGYFVIAGAVCGWYFTLSDANGNKIIGGEHGGSRAPIFASFYRAIRYHLGTIAFAALIIAIVQMIRVTVKYIEVKTRSNPPNYLQRVIFCLIHCCLKCIECCLDKISKNALVWTAMWGDPFLSASCSSFQLIWRNLGRVAAIHMVSDIILLVGKLSIVAMTVGLCALLLANAQPWKETVSSAFVPCIVIGILSYFVAWIFFLTFETVIDTTFLCFLVDSENAEKHQGEAMFASKGLQQLVGKYQLRSAMESEHQKKEAAEIYRHIGGKKVQQDHEQAVAHLNRAVTARRAETGDPEAYGASALPKGADGHRHGWEGK